MKIENCHPKIEDRIDLRLCPQEVIKFSETVDTFLDFQEHAKDY